MHIDAASNWFAIKLFSDISKNWYTVLRCDSVQKFFDVGFTVSMMSQTPYEIRHVELKIFYEAPVCAIDSRFPT